MKSPCKDVVWDVLPAIRVAIALELEQKGVSQLEAARMLDIAPSAVSQYLSKKWGYRIVFNNEVKTPVQKPAKDLIVGTVDDVVPRICEICRHLREAGSGCEI